VAIGANFETPNATCSFAEVLIMPHSRIDPHTATSSSQPAKTTSTFSPDAAALNAFVGEWRAEGEQIEGPVGPAAAITATQRYEWLQGKRFLIHRFDGQVGTAPASCVEVIGCDRDSGLCRAHTFYNNGLTNVWDVELHGGRWRLFGDWNMAGRSMKVRCAITFHDGGRGMRSHWEYSSDGIRWHTFWDLKAKKAIPH
jgi:hypothetical protein